MQYRPLGRTGIDVSAIAFGAGPVSGWMNEPDAARRLAVVQRAVNAGINWFDTAPSYGNGLSERCLGEALAAIKPPRELHVATKVRLQVDQLDTIADAVEASVTASLERLGMRSLTLLQLHNAITLRREDEPFSITPEDVLKPRGVAEAFAHVKRTGKVRCLGLTGLGNPDSLRRVIREFGDASGERVDTVQTPYHMLNPSGGSHLPGFALDTSYGGFFSDCAVQGVGVFAIRVFAGGALLGNPPSAHTHVTPFFPLPLYERDTQRAMKLRKVLSEHAWTGDSAMTAIRFTLGHPAICAAILGFALPEQIDQAVRAECFEKLPQNVSNSIFAELQ
jgi:D-threo-aldose 1-dehydrogenase